VLTLLTSIELAVSSFLSCSSKTQHEGHRKENTRVANGRRERPAAKYVISLKQKLSCNPLRLARDNSALPLDTSLGSTTYWPPQVRGEESVFCRTGYRFLPAFSLEHRIPIVFRITNTLFQRRCYEFSQEVALDQ
jgi:hypothetical protein